MQNLATITATDFLTPADQRTLIAAAQDVPMEIVTTGDGEERAIYGKTPASEAALERLTTAFIAALRKAARGSKVLDSEDAFSIALGEFVAAVRRYDLSSDVPFSATISTILARAISDSDRTSDIVVVRENVAARYWRLMHRHDFNTEAAYTECRDTSNGFDPATFLSVHRAIGHVQSLDIPTAEGEAGNFGAHETIASISPGPEELAVQEDLVAWLFTLTTERQERILRLRFGFCDVATEKVRVAAGYQLGEDLSDVQVAHAISVPRPTVQRDKKRALDVMRVALQDLVDEAEAE